MKNLFLTFVVCFSFFAASAQESVPGILSPDSKKVEVILNRPPQKVVTQTVDRTETVTAEAITDLRSSVEDLSTSLTNLANDAAQTRIASALETANTERWSFLEVLGAIVIGLLGLWFVLSNLDLQRFLVAVNQPTPPTPTPPTPTPTNDEIRAIVLETLGEGDYFRSSAYAESRGIAVRAGGSVTIITGGSKKERRKAILLSTTTPAPAAAPQGGNQTAPAAADSQE